MYLGSVGTYLSSLRTLVTLKTNIGDIAMGILAIRPTEQWVKISPWSTLPYISISLSLNILLTLMIVVRLVLYGRKVRAATGSLVGFGGLYVAVATMLIESSALFAVSSLVVIGTWAADSRAANAFTPILAQTQVRAFPRPRPPDRLSHVTMEWTGHRFAAHHPTSCRQERVDKQYYCPRNHQFIQSWDQRGVHGW